MRVHYLWLVSFFSAPTWAHTGEYSLSGIVHELLHSLLGFSHASVIFSGMAVVLSVICGYFFVRKLFLKRKLKSA